MSRAFRMASVVCLAWVMVSCGGAYSPPPPVIRVAISPGTATIDPGGTQGFSASVTGTTNTAVSWSIQEGSAGGSITSAGVYTAPQATGTFHVIAASVQDPSKRATAVVIVPQISIQISPTSATLPVNTTFSSDFEGLVTGAVNDAVSWSMREGSAGGTIGSDPFGCFQCATYSAPATPGTYHVIATSVADASKSAVATVTVTPPVLSMFPPAEILGPEGPRQFGASILGITDQSVTWSVQEGSSGGSVDANGLYTAPSAQGTYHLVATSTADASVTGTAAITVVGSGFKPTGAMIEDERVNPTATLLQDGRVLVAGGSGRSTLASAEIYDPVSGTFSPAGSMTTPRAGYTATLLTNGQVLMVGGTDGNSILQSAELFDPVTNAFSPTGNLNTGRSGHTATLLSDGRVLIAGGIATTAVSTQEPTASCEVYDPRAGNFSVVADMTTPRYSHSATLLNNGKVLLAGGHSMGGTVGTWSTNAAELFDPASGTFSPTGKMLHGHRAHTATLLTDGRVLLAGGSELNCFVNLPADGEGCTEMGINSAEIYDPASGQFTSAGSMTSARAYHIGARLEDGRVLLAGGLDANSLDQSSAELFDPAAGTFSPVGSLEFGEEGQAAVLLNDGRVLVVGGIGAGNGFTEIYTPSAAPSPAAMAAKSWF